MNTKIFFCEMLRHIKPDVIYDIGSRDGKEAILFKKIIRSAEVTAFEVNPTLVQRIKILPEFKNGNVLLMNCAVSDKDGVSDFFISDADYDADYDMDWRVGTSSLREKTAHGSKRRISVRTYTLDTLLSNKKGKSIVLWIDIEGCSCEALSGMNEISGQVKMIHAEIETKEFWKGQRLFDDILSLMREKGF